LDRIRSGRRRALGVGPRSVSAGSIRLALTAGGVRHNIGYLCVRSAHLILSIGASMLIPSASHRQDNDPRSQHRIAWVDLAKGLGIFLVVFVHTLGGIERERGSP